MDSISSNLYDLDMERSLLSAIVFEQDNLGEIYDIISPKDFYLKAHEDIFAAMQSCLNSDDPVDVAFVKKHLGIKFNEEVYNSVLTTNSIIKNKKYVLEFKYHDQELNEVLCPVKKEATMFVESIAQWQMEKLIADLEMEEAYELCIKAKR